MKHWSRLISICFLLMITGLLFCFPAYALSPDNGLPEGYEPDIYNAIPAQQFKDVFETETIEISGIRVICDSPGFIDPFNDTVHFRIFNSTTQETEYEVDTINTDTIHTLPPMQLRKNHNYIFFVEDPRYMRGSKIYVQILPDDAAMAKEGAGAYDYKYVVKGSGGEDLYNKEYRKLSEIKVFRRDEPSNDPRSDARFCIGCPEEFYAAVTYNDEPVTEKLKFRFESDQETFSGGTDENGVLYANLLEDVTYMVYLDSQTDKYVMDPFPIVVKDKSEYKEGRFAYNHTTCTRVDPNNPVKLFDAGKTDFSDQYESNTEVTSLKGNVTVSGMSFRHLLILDRVLDNSLAPGMDGKDYEVIGITAVNPHRWEISKLVGTDFNITKKIGHDRYVSHVYYLDRQGPESDETGRCIYKPGELHEIDFTQDSPDEISFVMDSLSLYPVVIEFDPDKTYEQVKKEEEAARKEAERKAKETEWKGVTDKSLPFAASVKLDPGKKKLKVRWKKFTSAKLKKAGKIRIEVQYSLYSKFPMDKTKSRFTGRTKSSTTISSLKSGKTYYVRVRTVKTVKGVKHVSKWSKVKKAKIK